MPTPEIDMTDDPDYHAFVEEMAKECHCTADCTPCDSILAGGPCEMNDGPDDDWDDDEQ